MVEKQKNRYFFSSGMIAERLRWWFTRRMPMTMSVRMALLTRWRAASPDWKRCWRTADTKDGNWPIPYAKSSVRSLPLFSVRTSLRRNSPCCHSDVLWSALSPGWKTFEELPLITSSIPIRARRRFSSPSADSCITNYATEIKQLLTLTRSVCPFLCIEAICFITDILPIRCRDLQSIIC